MAVLTFQYVKYAFLVFVLATVFVFVNVIWKPRIISNLLFSRDSVYTYQRLHGDFNYTTGSYCICGSRNGTNALCTEIQNFLQFIRWISLEAILIEPSLLYCLLSPEQRVVLNKRGFNISKHFNSPNIITFAILSERAKFLESHRIMAMAESRGFQHVQVRGKIKWLQSSKNRKKTSAIHYYFSRQGFVAHLVIFYEKGNYYWFRGLTHLPPDISSISQNLSFTSNDSAFDRFSVASVQVSKELFLNVPSNPSYFLLQIDSSNFLECDLSRAKYISKNNTITLEYLRLKSAFTTAINELKLHLGRLPMLFFIFGGSLLGWYRQCDIIPYTSDIDFAAWAKDADEKYWINTFVNNTDLKMWMKMGLEAEALEFALKSHGTRVDVFFIYHDKNTTWGSGHRPSRNYYFRYSYPLFSLCSADLLGHRVNVPCNAEDVIIAEYGPNWMKPKSSWGYESSPRNMGPRKYWPDKLKDHVFKSFS